MAFDFYFVSVLTAKDKDFALSLNVNSLVSYYYKDQLLKLLSLKKAGSWKGKLMVDNGAYSYWKRGGTVDIDEYLDFINDNIDYINYAVALDKIPGTYGVPNVYSDVIEAADITYSNFMYMWNRIKDRSKLMPVFHQDEPFEYLEKYLDIEGLEYICIASHGMSDKFSWYLDCFRTIQSSNNPNIKTHCLGATLNGDLNKLSFSSADASTWVFACMSGCVITSVGRIYVGSVKAIDNLKDYPVFGEVQQVCDSIGIDNVYDLAEELSARQKYTIYELFTHSINDTCNKINPADQLLLF